MIIPGVRAKGVFFAAWGSMALMIALFSIQLVLNAYTKFPIGSLLILFSFLTMGVVWSRKTRREELKVKESRGRMCLTCGYELTGDGVVACSECGRAQSVRLTREFWKRALRAEPWYDEGDRVMPRDEEVQRGLYERAEESGRAFQVPWLMRDKFVPRALKLRRNLATVMAFNSLICLALFAGIWIVRAQLGRVGEGWANTQIGVGVAAIGCAALSACSLFLLRKRKKIAAEAKGFACLGCAEPFEELGGETKCSRCGRWEFVSYTREMWRVYFGLAFWPRDEAASAAGELREGVAAESAGAPSGDGPT